MSMTEKLYSNAKLVKDFRIDVDDGRAHAICLDLQPDFGSDMGPSALELCVMSFAGCYATIAALTAKKMRVTLEDLEVEMEAIKSDKTGTLSEVSLNIMIKAAIPEDRIQQLHKLTVKGCPVGKIFEQAGIKTSYSVKIEKT
jgi:putative redox protein